MKFSRTVLSIATACAALSCVAPASAAVLTSVGGSSANIVTDLSTGSALSFDFDLVNFTPVTLNFAVEAADLSSSLSFNTLIRNLTGFNFGQIDVELTNATFTQAGTITPTFGTRTALTSTPTRAFAAFNPGEPAELYFGNPLALPQQSDWLLSVAGRAVGDSFSIRTAVPEPATYALLGAGLLLLGMSRRRQQ
ncbi:MAG: PEP-CTERM sorting domain-containing protein [Pseudomonadota bacterium]